MRLQFTVRHLLVVTTIVALALAAANTWRECRMENLVERFNTAIREGRMDDAEQIASLAVLLHPRDRLARELACFFTLYHENPDFSTWEWHDLR